MGARAYTLIHLVEFNPGEIAVEIGSERGEGSTEYLSQYLEGVAPFYSVDVLPRTEITTVSDGTTWLKKNIKPIRFCYLDNFDFIFDQIKDAPWLQDQKEEYRDIGLELNNENSKNAHLNQSIELNRVATKGCLVVIDDTWFDGEFQGKGALAVPWLLNNGWTLFNEVGDSYKAAYAALLKEQL